jgi:hypothetical protein
VFPNLTVGDDNIAVGDRALTENATGNDNIAIGSKRAVHHRLERQQNSGQLGTATSPTSANRPGSAGADRRLSLQAKVRRLAREVRALRAQAGC